MTMPTILKSKYRMHGTPMVANTTVCYKVTVKCVQTKSKPAGNTTGIVGIQPAVEIQPVSLCLSLANQTNVCMVTVGHIPA